MLHDFFYFSSDPFSGITGTYNPFLVTLSYFIASFASYVALDIAKNLHSNVAGRAVFSNKWWLLGGAFTLGAGIWTMHFVGMQAFQMAMPMSYDLFLTILSMFFAIAASGIAFLIVTMKKGIASLLVGGVIIGLGISTMHYVGMSAMLHMHIRYIPSLFSLSILIAIFASQTALWAMMRSGHNIFLNMVSALVMGAGICGMHYVGMSAAVFYPEPHNISHSEIISPELLSFYIATMTILIVGIGLLLSTYRQYTLGIQTKINLELQTKELMLQKQQRELFEANIELEDREKKTRAILNTAADAIITVDDEANIQTCNPATEEMFGYSTNEFQGKNIGFFLRLVNQQPLSIDNLHANHIHNLELVGVSKKEESFPVELSVSKFRLTQGDYFVLILRDISERKQSEKKLAELNKQLLGIARQTGKAEIANSILHNVGNVLNSVNISASMLKEKLVRSKMFTLEEAAQLLENHKDDLPDFLSRDPKGIYFAELIKFLAKTWKNEFFKQLEELDSLSNKIEHMKHIIQHQQSFEAKASLIEEINIPILIQDAVNMSNIQKEQPELTVDIECVNPVKFSADKGKLLQILINILQNAKEALIESNVQKKRILIKSSVSENQNLIIEIADNGMGISPENLKRIFTFGFSTKVTGHGLGLHASAITAREMNGSLSVKSEGMGKGAVFTLELPDNHLGPIL